MLGQRLHIVAEFRLAGDVARARVERGALGRREGNGRMCDDDHDAAAERRQRISASAQRWRGQRVRLVGRVRVLLLLRLGRLRRVASFASSSSSSSTDGNPSSPTDAADASAATERAELDVMACDGRVERAGIGAAELRVRLRRAGAMRERGASRWRRR